MKHEPMPENRESGKKYEQETEAFHGLLNALSAVPDISRAERSGVAFVVEDFKNSSLDTWKEELGKFEDELHGVEMKEGVAGLTWRMANEIERRYDAFLEQKIAGEKNPARVENMKMVRGLMKVGKAHLEQAYKSGRRVPIGAVVAEHVPVWYQFT